MGASPYIWIANPPKQRLTHVLFRRELRLNSLPKHAELSLHASTLYHLRVNGVMLGMGPVRGYPDAPEYDTYDLIPYLQEGDNVIALDVAHVGLSTFHHRPAPGGFIAWGDVVEAGGESHDLSSTSDWRCLLSRAHEGDPPCFSFAQGPLHLFDEREEVPGWDRADPVGGEWQTPIKVTHQGFWGELHPRSIPHLTQDEVDAHLLVGAYAHCDRDRIVSFRRAQQGATSHYGQAAACMFAYTYIHSPVAQRIPAGMWWGEHYLNGEPVAVEPEPDNPGRQKGTLELREGWNALFVSYGLFHAIWEFQLAYPVQLELRFSAARDGDGPAFRVTDALAKAEAEQLLEQIPFDAPETFAPLADKWNDVEVSDTPVSPARGLVWRSFDSPLGLSPFETHDLPVPAGRDSSLVFDMGRTVLGRIFVEFDAPPGTVFDAAVAEDMNGNRPYHYKTVVVQNGERHIARGGNSRMETFEPRGFRYLELGVTNHSKPVTVKRVGVVSQRYPYTKRGVFSCSDPALETLWEYGWNTVQLCSEDVITDTPWRERTLYGGDLLVEAASTLVTARDQRLVRRCLELFVQSQDPETGWISPRAPFERGLQSLYDYQFLVLVNTEWYCRIENDLGFAQRCREPFGKLMEAVRRTRTPDGLYPSVCRPFVEHGYPIKGAQYVSMVHSLLVQTFRAWASLLDMCDEREEAVRARQDADDVVTVLHSRFWDETQKAYLDALPTEEQSYGHGIAANAWAILFGDAPVERYDNAAARMAKLLEAFDPYNEPASVSSYGAFYMLGALYKTGHDGLAERAMRQVYQLMLTQPTGTIWEHANPSKSLSHAWSTAPNFYLSTRALGVRLAFPETEPMQRITIAPQSETLQWARGTVPHPRGDVHVEWEVRGDTLLLDYQVPDGVEVKVAPQGRLGRLRPYR